MAGRVGWGRRSERDGGKVLCMICVVFMMVALALRGSVHHGGLWARDTHYVFENSSVRYNAIQFRALCTQANAWN
jgi:hypothetical protein